MATEWVNTVKKTFKQGRLSNPAYQFKDALKDAKKYYKKGKETAVDVAKKTKKTTSKYFKKSNKSRKSKKSRKSRRSTRSRK